MSDFVDQVAAFVEPDAAEVSRRRTVAAFLRTRFGGLFFTPIFVDAGNQERSRLLRIARTYLDAAKFAALSGAINPKGLSASVTPPIDKGKADTALQVLQSPVGSRIVGAAFSLGIWHARVKFLATAAKVIDQDTVSRIALAAEEAGTYLVAANVHGLAVRLAQTP